MAPILSEAEKEISAQKDDVARLVSVATEHPFYKYNQMWSRELQNLVFSIEFCSWLGGFRDQRARDTGFMTIEEVGKFLNGRVAHSVSWVRRMGCWFVILVPVNLKDQDAFHLTIEEYLLALVSLVEELVCWASCSCHCTRLTELTSLQSRLAVNSVTLGDCNRPLEISRFISDIHAGFQLLNLKNDILRKRSDGIKYSVWPTFLLKFFPRNNPYWWSLQQVKKVEDVVYDLSLRNLIPKKG